MERMRTAIDKAKSAIHKAQDDMKRYYDRRRTPAPVFNPGDRVFLDALDIWTTCPSQKLSHRRLGPFAVERQIRPMAYRLKLPHWMKQLHPVFNVVKLTPALDDLITGRKTEDHPPPIVINGEAEWEVRRYLTVAGTGEDSNISLSGRNMATNTTLGSPLLKSPHQNSQQSSIANTLGLRDTSDVQSLTTFFIPSLLLQDVAILKGGEYKGTPPFPPLNAMTTLRSYLSLFTSDT